MNFRFVAVLASFVACCAMTLPAQTSTYVTYKFALISYPGAIDTEAYGVNNHNVVVGVYTDSSQMQHGFKVTNGTFVAINVPGALETRAFGINDNGDIVGSYTLPNPPTPSMDFSCTAEPSKPLITRESSPEQKQWASITPV
jgi:uncharacterized membrane protein